MDSVSASDIVKALKETLLSMKLHSESVVGNVMMVPVQWMDIEKGVAKSIIVMSSQKPFLYTAMAMHSIFLLGIPWSIAKLWKIY